MLSATPRRAGVWHAAQPACGLADAFPARCCAWSNIALKLRIREKLFSGGFGELSPSVVWQMVQIEFSEEGVLAAVN